MVSVREAKDKFTAICRNLNGEPAIVTKNGKQYVAIVELKGDMDLETFLMSHSSRLRRMLNSARRGPFISGDHVRRRIESDNRKERSRAR